MTIHITCECGKELQASSDLIGWPAVCPACQRSVSVPGYETPAQPVPPKPASVIAPFKIGIADSLSKESLPRGPATNKLVPWGVILGLVSMILVAALLLQPAVHRGREPVGLITSKNNLQQIGLAIHTFHDAYMYFPSENAAPPTVPSKLSWRVQILPDLEQQWLFDQFHHDEPWDSSHNIKLLPLMPKVYHAVRFQPWADKEKGLTCYRGFVGSGGVLGANPPLSLIAFEDASYASNTLMVVEAGEAVPWTKPEDPDFNENGSFGGPKRKDFLALFVDGHVQTFPQNFDRQMIRRMINWQNTEPVNLP